MFRNRLLGGISQYALLAAEDEKGTEKSAVEKEREFNAKEREGITVTGNVKEEVKEEEVKEEVDEVKEEVEAKEEEIDDAKAELKEATTDKEKDRAQKRIDKLTAQNAASKKRIGELEAALAAKPDDEKVLTQEDVKRLAKEEAQNIVIQQEFDASINRIVESCKKLDKDYKVKVDAMAEEAGAPIPGQMIGILDDMPGHGGTVLMYLAKNTDEYEEIVGLSPARMALKLKDISDKVNKKPNKEISKVPEPKDLLQGKGTTPEGKASEKDDMDSFVRKRNKEQEEYRKNRAGYH